LKRKDIFIGFNKDKKRCLLYKLDSNTYIDLESNIVYTVDELLDKTILPYTRFIKLKGFPSKRSIKKHYQEDALKTIPLDDLYIGDLGEVTKIYGYKESQTKFNMAPFIQTMCMYCNMPMINEDWYMPEYVDYKYSYKVIAKDVLLQRIESGYKDPGYICLISNTKISNDKMLEVGDIVVGNNIKPFKEVIEVNEELLPKNKVMELHMNSKTKRVDND